MGHLSLIAFAVSVVMISALPYANRKDALVKQLDEYDLSAQRYKIAVNVAKPIGVDNDHDIQGKALTNEQLQAFLVDNEQSFLDGLNKLPASRHRRDNGQVVDIGEVKKQIKQFLDEYEVELQ